MKPENEIAFHQRAQHDILAKMKRIYGLDDADLNLPSSYANYLEQAITEAFQDKRWPDRRSGWRETPDTIGNNTRAVEELTREAITRYAQAIYARSQIHKARDAMMHNIWKTSDTPDSYTNFYVVDPHVLHAMDNLYVNHLTQEVQQRLTLLTGGNVDAAFAIHTFLAGKAIDWARHEALGDYAYINPPGDRGISPTQNVEEFKLFGKIEARDLHYEHERRNVARPLRATAQEGQKSATTSDEIMR